MAAAGRRRGRRDNGLDAADWRAIDDLDPRVSEDVLDLLAAAGIAAYVQPAVDVDPITRSATMPSRPSDRLFVDRQRTDAARDRLRQFFDGPASGPPADGPEPTRPDDHPDDRPDQGPDHRPDAGPGADPGPPRPAGGTAEADLDATFASIVAGFDRPVDPTAAPWPSAENVSHTTTPEALPEPPPDSLPEPPPEPRASRPTDARHVTEPSLLDALDTFGAGLPDDDAPAAAGGAGTPPDRFVPPPPPPLPRLSRQAVLGGLAILVGLVLLLGGPDVVPLDRSGTILLGFSAILGGAVALILRLRPGTDPEDRPPDDGAQV